MQQSKFNFPIIIMIGTVLGLLSAGTHYLFYINNWVYSFGFAGLITGIAPLLFFPVGAIIAIFYIRKKLGSSSFLQVMAHCVLIAFMAAATKGGYNYVFYHQIEPAFDIKVSDHYIQQRKAMMKEATELKQKQFLLEQIASIEKAKTDSMATPKTYLSLFQKELTIYLILGLLFGAILGFIFKNLNTR